MKSADAIARLPGAIARLPLPRILPAGRNHEREFLPAALEIVETPASPVGRTIAATIIAFFCAALVWACFGRVDILATAKGRIVPSGRVKVVQPLETGIVSAIQVKDGDQVKAGQVLIELDRTISMADRERAQADLMQARLDVARLSALRAGLDGAIGAVGFTPPPGAPQYLVEQARSAMQAQVAEQAAKLASLEQQIAQKKAEAEEVAATVAKLQASLPWVEQEADVRKKAASNEFGNRIAYLEIEQKLVEQQHELLVQSQRADEVAAARQALERQLEQTKAEYAHGILSDLADAEQSVAEDTADAVTTEQKAEEQVLRAPVDGTVQQLAVHTVGGVVTPAQQLLVVVPAEARLEVEAMVSNRDIGFVNAGEPAEIKVDTFNFTKYGLLHGDVVSISRDAILHDKPVEQDESTKPGDAAEHSSEPQGQELTYAARVSLDRTKMDVDGKLVNLEPGMAVTVEIKTGTRRVIEYLLSPLLRYREESLRER